METSGGMQETMNGTQLRVLIASTLYAPEEVTGPVAVVLDGPRIRTIWSGADAARARQLLAEQMPDLAIEVIDLGELRLAPGYIDIHTHGFRGKDVTTGTEEDIAEMARQLPGTGVTSFFPTIATTGIPETKQQVERTIAVAANLPKGAADIVGIRLEGPYISHAKKGAQFEPGIRPPDSHELEELVALSNGLIRLIDYAPEEDQSDQFLATVVKHGIVPCIGHTAATYERVIQAIDAGAKHSTHLFNAMSNLGHRAPGVPGALLTDQRATVEVIADGIHVHPAMVKLAVIARGPRDLALITDAVSPAGLPDGVYDFIHRTVNVSHGAITLEDGTLAGSALVLDRAVRNVVAFAGISWSDAIRMATLTPAQISGIADRKGHIVPGADADLLALDAQGNIKCAWTRGDLAYKCE